MQLLEFIQLFVGTVKLRPYVFIFLAVYLVAALRLLGGKRTLLFTAVCWILAFLSEFSSTRNGFPYGWYHYIEATRDQELWVFNVPFMDSLSYTFLQFAAFNTTLFMLFPSKKGALDLTEGIKFPTCFALLSALMVTYLDIIIDPIAHQGDKWFLGKIYYYPTPGAYFDIPIFNFLGWFIVGFVSIRTYLFLEKKLEPRDWNRRDYNLPFKDAFGVMIYLGVIVFNLAVTWYVGDIHLLLTGIYIVLLPSVLWCILVFHKNRANP